MLKIGRNVASFAGVTSRLVGRKNSMPGKIANALNWTGLAVKDALRDEMRQAFDRPTPYTLNSLLLLRATPNHLSALIRPKEQDAAGKGTPAKNYLGPEIWGGGRHDKRSEIALRFRNVLPAGMYTVPGAAASLDLFGNQSPGEIRQILSYFGAAQMHLGYTSNMTDKTKARLARGTKKQGFGYEYFVVKTKQGNLAPGIYRKMMFRGARGKNVYPIIMFVKKPAYSRRYRWNEVAGTVARQMFERYLTQELSRSGGGR